MTVDWLVGQVCEKVERHTEHSSAFRFDAATLIVESLWRIVSGGRLRRTSGDDGQRFGLSAPVDVHVEASNLLGGRRVTAASFDGTTGDLALTFEHQIVLQVITDSAGYESWTLSAPGRLIVCASGGVVHDLTP